MTLGIACGYFLCFCSSGFAQKSALDEIMAAGVIKVAMDANYPPQSYKKEDGTMEGFDVCVAQVIGKRLGVKVEFLTPAWEDITCGNWNKKWDISVGSMTPTKERKKVLLFTIPYYSTQAQFAIHRENTAVQTIDDLKDKTIGVTKDSTNQHFMDHNLQIEDVEVSYLDWKPVRENLILIPDELEMLRKICLDKGSRLDAIFTSRQFLIKAIREGSALKLLGKPIFYEPMSVAIDKNRCKNEALLAKLNEVIQSMYDDEILKVLSRKFFHTNLVPER